MLCLLLLLLPRPSLLAKLRQLRLVKLHFLLQSFRKRKSPPMCASPVAFNQERLPWFQHLLHMIMIARL